MSEAPAWPTTTEQTEEKISLAEAVKLGAADPLFYSEFFFAKTVRQHSPTFHREMWDMLTEPHSRYLAMMIFRGGAKTSILRLFVSFCIAYGISRTILFVGKSEDAAMKSVEWLMNAVERNTLWAGAFGLRKGKKWTSGEIDIWHSTDNVPIRVIAYGMTGSIRGVNVDDYRPDLIVVDDPCDEENTATPEQRKKVSDLFFGALMKSLAPSSEAPLAKMALLQTVLNENDLVSICCKDPQWKSVVFGCFDETGASRWPERWTTAELLAEKNAHIARNQLSLWLREMECKLVSDETSLFLPHWLKRWEVLPEGGYTWISVDPTPPPKESARGKVNEILDTAVIMVLRRVGPAIYVCETYGTRSPDPDEFCAKFFELAVKWRVKTARIETVLFARMLKTLLQKEMIKRRIWVTIHEVEDRRRKATRIGQEIQPLAANGQLYCHESHVELIEQFNSYPAVNHDDYLDALAIGLMPLTPRELGADDLETIEGEYELLNEAPKQIEWAHAP